MNCTTADEQPQRTFFFLFFFSQRNISEFRFHSGPFARLLLFLFQYCIVFSKRLPAELTPLQGLLMFDWKLFGTPTSLPPHSSTPRATRLTPPARLAALLCGSVNQVLLRRVGANLPWNGHLQTADICCYLPTAFSNHAYPSSLPRLSLPAASSTCILPPT